MELGAALCCDGTRIPAVSVLESRRQGHGGAEMAAQPGPAAWVQSPLGTASGSSPIVLRVSSMPDKAWGCGLVPGRSAPSTVASPSRRLTLNLPLKGSMELAGLPLE